MASPARWFRRARFVLLRRLVLPVVMPLLRWWIQTWRKTEPSDVLISELLAAPRLIIATFHGMLLHLLAFSFLAARHKRQLVVMISPSQDGDLLAAALDYFDIHHVRGTVGRRSVAGSREFIRRLLERDIGIIAVDGPRGPCCQAKTGALRVAAAAQAHVALTTTSAHPGLRFGSWDRAHLPLPFAKVAIDFRLLDPPAVGREELELTVVQRTLLERARSIESPVLPPELRLEDRG